VLLEDLEAEVAAVFGRLVTMRWLGHLMHCVNHSEEVRVDLAQRNEVLA